MSVKKKGEFGGIGIEVKMEKDIVKVIEKIEDKKE